MKKSEASKAVDAVFDAIAEALKGGDEVRLVGFGTFSVAARAASEGRNPRTGEKIQIAASKQAKFKPGHRSHISEITPLRAAVILYVSRNPGVGGNAVASALGIEPIEFRQVID